MKKGDKVVIVDCEYTPRYYIGKIGTIKDLGVNINCRWVEVDDRTIHFHENSLKIYYDQREQMNELEKSL